MKVEVGVGGGGLGAPHERQSFKAETSKKELDWYEKLF